MKGDFTRFTFDPKKHYKSVRMQQGRVQMDADWNEQLDITSHRIETETKDVIGLCGGPIDNAGFYLTTDPHDLPDEQIETAKKLEGAPGDFIISAGRYYVHGILCENDKPVLFTAQPDYPGAEPIGEPGTYLAYLDVWQRHLTAVDDAGMREVALGGPDTATRLKTIWQVKLFKIDEEKYRTDDCGIEIPEWKEAIAPGTGRLAARAQPEEESDKPCIITPGAGYRRLENQLYRVEIHTSGAPGEATFKWSRDNGSVLSGWEKTSETNAIRVLEPGRDDIRRFATGQWIELTDDHRELHNKPGVLVQIVNVEDDIVYLDDGTASEPLDIDSFKEGKKIYRWDSDCLLTVEDVSTNGGWIKLEDGVEVRFTDGSYKSGDYWVIPARTATGSVEWPHNGTAGEPASVHPHGIRHYYCKLGFVSYSEEKLSFIDCRRLFPPLTSRRSCCTYSVGDGRKSFGDFNSLEAAVSHLPQEGGQICLLPGEHETNLSISQRHNITITGCPKRTVLFPREGQLNQPVIDIYDSSNIDIRGIDFIAPEDRAIRIRGSNWEEVSNITIENNRILALTNGIAVERGRAISIKNNIIQLLNEDRGGAVVSLEAEEVAVQNNTISVAVAGEGVVRGFVLDNRTNEPVHGSHVVIRGHNLGSVSQADGSFSIHHVPVGRNTVVARMVGYQTHSEDIIVRADLTTHVDIRLERSEQPGVRRGFRRNVSEDETRFFAADTRDLHNILAHCKESNDVKPVIIDLVVHAKFLWTAAFPPVSRSLYRAFGGIYLKGGSERVVIRQNKIHGGLGNGVTLGGVIDESEFITDPEEDRVFIDHGKDYLILQNIDHDGQPISNAEFYLTGDAGTYTGTTNENGIYVLTSIIPGRYELRFAHGYKIDNIEFNEQQRIQYTITLSTADRTIPDQTGFLYNITIDANEINDMDRSGIGFERYRREHLHMKTGDNNLFGEMTDMITNLLAPRSIIATTNEVRDIVITANRILHCAHASIPVMDERGMQEIGYGGISLGMCESAQISSNHIYKNGARGTTPSCGIFIGYGENIEISDNTIYGNGVFRDEQFSFTGNMRETIRGGIYVRFAASLSLVGKSTTNHRPAIRIQDNRIDQPVGRALTIFAFGPVSCVNNHFNSEHAGNSMLDLLAGTVLILNLGGIFRTMRYLIPSNLHVIHHRAPASHTLTTNVAMEVSDFDHHPSVENILPAGGTLFNSNTTRTGTQHRTFIGQTLGIFDDLGFDGCQSYHESTNPVLINTMTAGGSIRLTDNRFTESSAFVLFSAYSRGIFMNTTAHNQADHCIITQVGQQFPGNLVRSGNIELNQQLCNQFREQPGLIMQYAVQQLAAMSFRQDYMKSLEQPVNTVELVTESSHMALQNVHDIQILRRQNINDEQYRLEQRFGNEDIRIVEFNDRLVRNVEVINNLKVESELIRVSPPVPDEKGAVVDGRLTLTDYRGVGGIRVELVNAEGVTLSSSVTTDRSGYYAITIPESDMNKLEREKVFIAVKDPAGNEVIREKDPIKVEVNKINRKEIHVVDPEPILTILRTPGIKRPPQTSTDLEKIKGIGPVRAAKLREAGIKDIETLVRTDSRKLVNVLTGMDVNEVKKEAEKVAKRKK